MSGGQVHSRSRCVEHAMAAGTAGPTPLTQQGVSIDAFEETVSLRELQPSRRLHAAHDGYWMPPDVGVCKSWLKAKQQEYLVREGKSETDRESQFGVKLLTSPGASVQRGEPVAELRYPLSVSLDEDGAFLAGTVVNEPVEFDRQVLKYYS